MKSVIAFVALIGMLAGCRATPTAPSATGLSGGSGAGFNQTLTIAGVTTLARGSRTQLRAFVPVKGGGQQDVTTQVAWTIGDLSIATIDSDGWIEAIAPGTTDVVARLQKLEGRLAVTVNNVAESSSSPSNPSAPSDPNPDPAPPGTPGSPPPQCLPPPLPPTGPEPVPCPFPLPTS